MKKIYAFIFAVFAVVLLLGINGQKAEAAKAKRIGNYSNNKYDVTNDGKPDEIKVKLYGYEKYKVFVNGKKVYAGKSPCEIYDIGMNYVRVSKKEIYLNLYGIGASYLYEFSYLLRYKNGKLQKVQSFADGIRQDVVRTSKKKMITECDIQPHATGWVTYEVVYKKKSGRWMKTTGTTYKIAGKEKFKSVTSLRLYKKSSCQGKFYNFKSGKNFELLKIKLVENEDGFSNCYGYFRCGKKKGWMFMEDYSKTYFADIYYAS